MIDLDAAAEMGEARAKETAWREGREATPAELEAGAELGEAQEREQERTTGPDRYRRVLGNQGSEREAACSDSGQLHQPELRPR